jgi:hypothetical protein
MNNQNLGFDSAYNLHPKQQKDEPENRFTKDHVSKYYLNVSEVPNG